MFMCIYLEVWRHAARAVRGVCAKYFYKADIIKFENKRQKTTNY